MAILKLPKTANRQMMIDGPTDDDYYVLDIPITQIDRNVVTVEDNYEYATINAIITFGRAMTDEEVLGLPHGYLIADGTKLGRQFRDGNLHPDHHYAWRPMLAYLAEGEDPLIGMPTEYTGYGSRNALLIYNDDHHAQCNHYIDKRIFTGNPAPRIKLSSLLYDWKVAPCGEKHNMPANWYRSADKNNKSYALFSALFPERLRPDPEEAPVKRTGRALYIEEPDGPTNAMVDLFIRATEHMGMELPTMMTLGLREDAMTYCPFRVPAWMTEPQWQGYTSERSALPASRVMIYRSQKAFHLLYVIAATAKTTCVFERMPMLYAIPVVVEVAEAHPDPVNLRGLPFTINQEIAKCKGLGNALQRGLNAVRGELLKLAKAGWQMDAFDGNDVELIKPRTHMVMVLKAHLGLTPFTFAADALPSLPTVLEDIQAKLSDKGYKPMLRPYDQGTAPVVQPVAPPKRAMML